ncbi:hypothetical protein HAX54_039954 [Datura stramonium]|uniref:Uncharacterized protein n=1 Tax=Datura stramonium TaxID=4076 RepID=A0ABS8VND6_DATST|nr:hypothetical protein [Datura stramonium]
MREVGRRCRGLAAAAGGFSGGAAAVEVGFGQSGGRRGGKGEGGAISPVVNSGKGKEKGDRRWFRPEKMEESGRAFYERFKAVDMVGENGEIRLDERLGLKVIKMGRVAGLLEGRG